MLFRSVLVSISALLCMCVCVCARVWLFLSLSLSLCLGLLKQPSTLQTPRNSTQARHSPEIKLLEARQALQRRSQSPDALRPKVVVTAVHGTREQNNISHTQTHNKQCISNTSSSPFEHMSTTKLRTPPHRHLHAHERNTTASCACEQSHVIWLRSFVCV